MELRIIGSGAIIQDKKILLEKRSKLVSYPGLWSLPGGQIDSPKEPLDKTAQREIKEETNLDFEPKKMLGFYEWITKDMHSIVHVFLGSHSGKIKIKKLEVEECKWFTYEEAKKLDLAFSYDQTIEDLHKLDLI